MSRSALVIDDDPCITELLEFMLASKGFEVVVINDGIDAVNLLRHYDVILLDLNMPVFDGERLAAYWMLTQPDILRHVIVLSGYSRFTRGRELPSFGWMRKPFDPKALLELVEQCARG
ncbi:MAG: response regulator [Acidobacteriota bacterium]